MTKHLKKFDVSDYLNDEETIAEYLNAVLENGDPGLLLAAIGDIAKAKGMKQIAQESGLGRESLYKALTPGAKPRFETVMKVLKVLGVNLSMKPAKIA
jgi:probable addiction module antidote protein